MLLWNWERAINVDTLWERVSVFIFSNFNLRTFEFEHR